MSRLAGLLSLFGLVLVGAACADALMDEGDVGLAFSSLTGIEMAT